MFVPAVKAEAPACVTPSDSNTVNVYPVAFATAPQLAARLVAAGVMLTIGQYDGLAIQGLAVMTPL